MVLPKVNKTYFQERDGVLKVGLIINSLGLIFRETPNADVGVDGMAEYVSDEGNATGKIIGLQIKSGESYFNEKDDYFKFYFDKKHRTYWETFPIPLILLLHNPITNQIYYVDVRHYFRNPKNLDKKYIEVDKLNILKSKSDIFYTSGVKNTKSREDFLGLGTNNLIRALNEKKLEFKDEIDSSERSRLYLEYLYKKIKEILNQENTCIISESFIYLDIKGNYSKFSEMKKLKLLYKQEN